MMHSRRDVSAPETEHRPQWKCDTMTGVKYGPPVPNSSNCNGNVSRVDYSLTKRREVEEHVHFFNVRSVHSFATPTAARRTEE